MLVSDHDAIRQLAARYAVAVDSRDLESLARLFVDDVDNGRHGPGRDALKRYYDRVLELFAGSTHQIGTHVIDLVDDDHGTGIVYCIAHHQDHDSQSWIVEAMAYFDTYERRDGQWYFVQRDHRVWWTETVREDGTVVRRQRPDREKRPRLPEAFPTWAAFWDGRTPAGSLSDFA